MTHLISDIFAVEIPNDAHSCEVYENNVIGGYCIMYLRGKPDYACEYSPNLPPGNYTLIGISDEMSEEQADSIVEKNYDYFKLDNDGMVFYTSVKLFEKLLLSKGLNKRYAIIKQTNEYTTNRKRFPCSL